jgi:3-deoxy-7-phosphoheptulonate synthase
VHPAVLRTTLATVLIGAGIALLIKAGLGIPTWVLVPFPVGVIVLLIVTIVARAERGPRRPRKRRRRALASRRSGRSRHPGLRAKSWAGALLGTRFSGTVMVVMTPDATPAQIEAVVERLEAAGVHAKVMPGELTTAIGAIGDPEGVREMGLEGLPGVDQVIPISRPYKLASSELSHHEPTVFEVDGRRVGGGETFCLIAGPCTVETPHQTRVVAQAVAAAGASMLRGGAFKPRTSPFSFQGLGFEALEILGEVRAETGLPVVSEMTAVELADRFAEVVDVIQVGARNMQNYGLLEVVGKLGKPVLLKRGLSSTLDELLQAADYVLKEGNERVILCERGIRTFDTAMRFTLDLGAVPWLKLHTHLPVIVDPSHASGDRRLVGPLSRAAAAVGADGIIVEVAEDPELALCDGPQQLYAHDFERFAREVEAHAALVGRTLA